MALPLEEPWVLLDNSVPFAPKADLHSEWEELKCLSKKAYNCGEYGDSLLEELLLLASVVSPPGLSSLCISASPRVIEASDGLCGSVVATDRELAVILARFEKFVFYLIYNSDDWSLTMIPYDLKDFPRSGLRWMRSMGASPVPVWRGYGSGDPVLVFLCQSPQDKPESSRMAYSVRLFPLAQPPLADQASSSGSGSGSAMHLVTRTAVFPRTTFFTRELRPCAEQLCIHDAFPWEGKFFWVDLLWGAIFCDAQDLLNASDDNLDQVQFQFIPLPPEHRLHLHNTAPTLPRLEVKKHRMMACVGGSIKFVSIETYFKNDPMFGRVRCLPPEPENRRLTVWALLPGTRDWVKESEFRVKDLWQHKDFEREELPKSPWGPTYPILCPKDGVLHMMIDDLEEDGTYYTTTFGLHIIQIHMGKDKILSVSSQRITHPITDFDERQPELASSRLFRCSRPISIERLLYPLAVRKGAVAAGHGCVSNQALSSM